MVPVAKIEVQAKSEYVCVKELSGNNHTGQVGKIEVKAMRKYLYVKKLSGRIRH